MQESPVDKIKKQFDVLATDENKFFVRDSIPVKVEGRTISYKNDVIQNFEERSSKAQKYFNYCQQYIAFFRSKSYQFLFSDYSLGRFVYEFDEDNFLISYNVYWNPCPFSPQFLGEIEKSGMDVCEYIDNIDFKEKIELNQIVLRTPIRFDYDGNYSGKNIEYHPTIHIHGQDKDTRAKSKKLFSLYSYFLFILENCYPHIYQDKDYEEKIEALRRLDQDTLQWLKVRKTSRKEMLGEKIRTEIIF